MRTCLACSPSEDTQNLYCVGVGDLDAALDALRRTVAGTIGSDDPEKHQIAVDQLVWCHAHAEAAGALREWADSASSDLGRDMATAAEHEARALLEGAGAAAAIANGERGG